MSSVTVVIPTRNRAASTLAAIASASNQTLRPAEIIIVDDGSTDGSDDQIEAALEPGARIIRQTKQYGANAARNIGVAAAQTKWVAFLDSDDVFFSNKLDTQLTEMENQSADFGVSGFQTDTGKIYRLGSFSPRKLLFWNCLGGCSGLIAKRSLLLSEPFDPSMKAVQDWELFLRLTERSWPCVIPEPLYKYDTSGNDRITRASRKRLVGHRVLYRRHVLGKSNLAERYHRLVQAELLGADPFSAKALCRRTVLSLGRRLVR